MKRVIYRFFSLLLTACMLAGITVTAYAETPYNNYTYWTEVSSGSKAVYNKPMYEASGVFSASDIGVAEFTKIQDICTDKNNSIYILDSNSRIVVLDSNMKLVREIGLIGGTESYNEAASIYIYDDGTIYICDTNGNRILHTSADGAMIETILLPESPLIPDDFTFSPVRIVRDRYDYLYVLSNGSYYGALLYAPDKSFIGFYGANTVSGTISNVIENIRDRVFPSNEKKANTAQKLPYSFVDIDIDEQGFIYTCNGFTSVSERKGQIRKLSPGTGKNILDSAEINFVDEAVNTEYQSGAVSNQNIIDIEVDNNGFIYGLESVYGKIFLYDSECNVITVFGDGMGFGTQVGNFVLASSMALINNGEKIAVIDNETNLITFFNITDYGQLVKDTVVLTQNGDYDIAKGQWEEIIKLDANFQPAYSGLARAYLDEQDYAKALDFAEKGYDRETYAVAFEYQRTAFINEHFAVIFVILALLLVGTAVLLAISSKKKLVFIRNREIHLMLISPLHPVNTFAAVKEKHYGSVGISVLLVIIYYISTVLQTLAGGFLFSIYDPISFNSLFILARSAGLVVLWVASNWLICTLLGGKGKLTEIIIVTSYSLIPLIAEKFIRLILSNILVPAEAGFLGILDSVAVIYFIIMLTVGLIKAHDFSMSRFVGTSLLSVVAIAAIVFLIVMLVILAQQFFGFILTVVTELITL